MSAIILKDAIVHYEVLGHGEPIIFLHSWIGSWRYWIPSMQFASSRNRAYAFDLWGYGATKKMTSKYSLEEQSSLLNGFVEQMGLQSFTLVGHGLGGIVAIYYAADHPKTVERLMVISFPMGTQNTNPRLRTLPLRDSADWLFGHNSSNEEPRQDATKADPEAISAALYQFTQVNWRQLITRVPVASLWIHGQNDQAINVPTSEQLNFLPEYAKYHIFNESGHYPMLDEPGKFNRLLGDFLKLDPGDDPRQLEIRPIWNRRIR
jgi:pimeloyl-ACP methyl ester carboxylesterase